MWWALVTLALLGGAIAFLYYLEAQSPFIAPPKKEPPIARILSPSSLDQLAAAWATREKTRMEELGDNGKTYQENIIDGDMDAAYEDLTKIISDSTRMKYTYHHYNYGVLNLLAAKGKAKVAVYQLEKAANFRKDVPFFLTIAYVENEQIEAAQEVLEAHPNLAEELPKEILDELKSTPK